MHWHILGAGAIGCIWAYRLHQIGHPVTLVLRNQSRLNDFNRRNRGISYQAPGATTVQSIPVEATLNQQSGSIDRLLICTKAFAVEAAFEQIKARLSPTSQIILLHNGMGPQQRLAARYPDHALWAASSTDGGYLTAPFGVVHAGAGSTVIGPLTSRASQEDSSPLLHTSVQTVADIQQRLWHKLAINAVINPLTALANCRNGELLQQPDRARLAAQLCSEIQQVTAQLFGTELLREPLLAHVQSICQQTAENYSSMQQDLQQRRTSEIEQINGYVDLLATQLGIPAPINRQLLQAVRQHLPD